MSEAEGRAAGEALLAHPDHELYDPAGVLEIFAVERALGIRLPPSYKALLAVGSGGILGTGDLLLGTKDPDALGATLLEVTRVLREEGLPPHLVPVIDGAMLVCLDLSSADADGECEAVEVDPESLEVSRRLGSLVAFVRRELL